MFTATVIVCSLLAGALAFSAALKLTHRPEVVEGYAKVGVPEERLNLLAGVLLAAAAGLIAGLFWAPIGVAAAAALVVYFLVAISAHIRFDDLGRVATPAVIALLSVAALALRIASL